jgi:transposase
MPAPLDIDPVFCYQARHRVEVGRMRGMAERQVAMLSVVQPDQRIRADHPIRRIKALADAELARLSPVFDQMYAERGRPSIPPERLLKACLLIALYSVRSERQFCEQLDYNLLFRWFLDLGMHEASFDASTFAKNKDRLLRADVARRFFEGVVAQAKAAHLLSAEHFTVDGTLIEAWASLKSFRPREERPGDRPPPDDPGNPTVDFHGAKRSNATHVSTTDPEAQLARKGQGKEAKLCFSGHVVMENRHGLCVAVSVAAANPSTERTEAVRLLRTLRRRGFRPTTVGGDKAYDTQQFVMDVRALGITPHVAQNITTARGSRIDARTTRQVGYRLSQWCRKQVEEIFGWGKTIGGLRKTRYRGRARTELWAYVVGSAYNLLRMTKLLPDGAGT